MEGVGLVGVVEGGEAALEFSGQQLSLSTSTFLFGKCCWRFSWVLSSSSFGVFLSGLGEVFRRALPLSLTKEIFLRALRIDLARGSHLRTWLTVTSFSRCFGGLVWVLFILARVFGSMSLEGDELVEVFVPDVAYDIVEEKYQFSLIGRVLTKKKFHVQIFKDTVRSLWGRGSGGSASTRHGNEPLPSCV
ncbi:hypothetical protein LIER_01373 [Lithospermum erythrorhizon]|uniref:Uncharacterized protein n=1 Tax=Lithospermum erythrorhizon TaxID=34254 RepID=A0AAV3NKR6_LITER